MDRYGFYPLTFSDDYSNCLKFNQFSGSRCRKRRMYMGLWHTTGILQYDDCLTRVHNRPRDIIQRITTNPVCILYLHIHNNVIFVPSGLWLPLLLFALWTRVKLWHAMPQQRFLPPSSVFFFSAEILCSWHKQDYKSLTWNLCFFNFV